MATAYTPGLRVSPCARLEKVRRLPLKGAVVVKVNQAVQPETVVARAEMPGLMQNIRLAEQLGIEPVELKSAIKVKVGDSISKGDVLATTKGIFGWFKNDFRSPVSGTVEIISETTGHIGIRLPPTTVEKTAYISGTVTSIIPSEGVTIECTGAMVQGIFGVGGEQNGELLVLPAAGEPLKPEKLPTDLKGKIIVTPESAESATLQRAAEAGAVGIVLPALPDEHLINYLRAALKDPKYDIGVAITGHEPLPLTIVLTEGFGQIPMARRTYSLLQSLNGRRASINGATQIRAGVIRPEIIIPLDATSAVPNAAETEQNRLEVGSSIRLIREPYFGKLATVSALPSEVIQVDSGAVVRVLEAKLEDGTIVVVPRANVEIIEPI